MAITVTPPLATPVVTLTPGEGGSLAAGTYEVGVACANTSSYTLTAADQRRSAAWIGQVVVTANQKITVSYPAVTDATHYNIYIRNVTTGETWYGGNRRHGTVDTSATTTLLSYDILSLGTRRPHFDNFTYDTAYFTPPIALNQGTIVVHISGTNSAIYYADLYNAINAAGLASHIFEEEGEFWLNGQLIIDSGATGSIAFYNFKLTSDQSLQWGIHFMQGIILNNSSTFTVTWGTTARNSTLYIEAWSWRFDNQYMECTSLVIMGGTFQKLRAQQYLWGGDHYINIGDNGGSTNGLSIIGAHTQNLKSTAIQGIKVVGAGFNATNANTIFQYCEGVGYQLTVNRTGIQTLRDSTISNGSFARHIRSRNSISGGIYLYDVKWKNDSLTLPTAGDAYLARPEIYWESGAAGLSNIFYQGAPFQVKVVDESGNVITGASVNLRNVTGSVDEFTENTDANGLTTSRDIVFESGQYDGSGVYGNGTGTDYSWKHTVWTVRSFKLTITKAGYETYISNFNFNGKTIITITLKAQVAKFEDDRGKVFDRVDKTNSGSVNLRRKIVKV